MSEETEKDYVGLIITCLILASVMLGFWQQSIAAGFFFFFAVIAIAVLADDLMRN